MFVPPYVSKIIWLFYIHFHILINDYLEEMAKTIYNYWFIQFDFPDENGKPYKSSGGKMSFCNELNREILKIGTILLLEILQSALILNEFRFLINSEKE